MKIPRRQDIRYRLLESKNTQVTTGTLVSWLLAALSLVFAMFVYFNSGIDNKIKNKFNDPRFVRRVANQIRLPFIIFDENETITVNSGAEEYIASHCCPVNF